MTAHEAGTEATGMAVSRTHAGINQRTGLHRSMLGSWRWYPKVSRIQNRAALDVGRGSETLATFARGDLFRAARLFACGLKRRALVVTGFFIPSAKHPAAETDGPVGAVEMCAALRGLGGDAWLVSDTWCEPVVAAAAQRSLPTDHVLIAPSANAFDSWLDSVRALVLAQHIDTIIYIERVGPAQDGVPKNMHGTNILEWTAPLSKLSELGLHMIGIGDGGNEIGMGRITTFVIEQIVQHGELIACRVPANELIVGGTSNWGAHAFVCALYAMGCRQLAPLLDVQWHRDTLADIAHAGGLDGVTMENTPTVDGLSESSYYGQIRALSNLAA